MNRTASKRNKLADSISRKKDYKTLLEGCIPETAEMPQYHSTLLSYLPRPIIQQKISTLVKYIYPSREFVFTVAGKMIDLALKLIRGVLALSLIFLIIFISIKGTLLFWLYLRYCGVCAISYLRDMYVYLQRSLQFVSNSINIKFLLGL